MQIKRGDLVTVKSGQYAYTNPGSYGIFMDIEENGRVYVDFIHVKEGGPIQVYSVDYDDLRLMTKLEKLIHGIDDVRRDD